MNPEYITTQDTSGILISDSIQAANIKNGGASLNISEEDLLGESGVSSPPPPISCNPGLRSFAALAGPE